MVKVLFVCLGNICRSPTAEGVFRKLVEEQGLSEMIMIDSAGTHAYHIGKSPDPRAQEAASKRGIDLSGLRGRQAVPQDIIQFDYVLAMDEENYENLLDIAPPEVANRVQLLLQYAPGRRERSVPDPYYGGASGFDRVLDMVEEAAAGLLQHIRDQHKL